MALIQQGKLTDKQTAENEYKQVQKDQAEAVKRAAAEKEAIDKLAKEDAKKDAKAKADALKAENAVLKKQISEREKFLATPLTDADKARLQELTDIANSGKSVPVELMTELADLRVRSKVETPEE